MNLIIGLIIMVLTFTIFILACFYKDKKSKEIENKISISKQTTKNLEYMFYKILGKK